MLFLGVGGVAHPHRTRSVIAGEMIENALGEFLLTADAIHDLQRVVLGGNGFHHPVDEGGGHVGMADAVQHGHRHRGVAQPAEPVVPVAFLADGFRQRGGGGGEKGAGGAELEHLEHQRAAQRLAAVLQRQVGARGPQHPIGARALQHQVHQIHVRNLHLVVITQEQEGIPAQPDFAAGLHRLRVEAGPQIHRFINRADFAAPLGGGLEPGRFERHAGLAAGIFHARIEAHPDARIATQEMDFPHHVRSDVIGRAGPSVRSVARHEVDQVEGSVRPFEGGDQDVGILLINLAGHAAAGHLNAERAAVLLIEQGGKHGAGIKGGQAAEDDAAERVNQGTGAPIADHAEVIVVC